MADQEVKAQPAAEAKDGKQWYQSKTVWTGVIGVVGAAGAYATGDMGSADAIQTGIASLLAIFLRMGMLS